MSQSSGGFFYSVKAVVDKASFESGRQELAKLEQSGKRLIAGFTAAGAALVGAAKIAGNVAQSELKVARSIGVSTDALSKWKTAASIAGASANGLIGAMAGIENKMQHLKTGSVDMNLAKNLGLMGIGYGDFADMDAEDRMKAVFSRADSMEDQKLAATLVGDILGQAGREYYDSLKLSGKTLDQQLKEAQSLNFMTEKNRKEAAIFAGEFNGIKEAGKSIAQLIGSDIAAELTPLARKIKTYLMTNQDAIRRGITGLAKGAGSVFNTIAGAIGKVAPFVEKLIDRFGGLDKVIIKLGVGFGAMKLMKFAGGLRSMISGLNLLKLALGGLSRGLIAGGLFLVLEDLMVYFMGGKSLIGEILPKIKEFSKNLGIDDKLTAAMENFKKAVSSEEFQNGMNAVSDFLKFIGGNAVQAAVDGISSLAEALNSLFSGDWVKALEGIGGIAEVAGNLVGASVTGTDYNDFKEQQEYTIPAIQALQKETERNWLGLVKKKNFEDLSPETQELVNKAGGKQKFPAYINDGIICPDGRTIGISPDDWVFAAKNVEDMASAFIPHGMTTNNSMSAPTSYVINQSFTVNGGNSTPQAVRAEAYKGTAAALQNNLKNAARIMQLMPGTR